VAAVNLVLPPSAGVGTLGTCIYAGAGQDTAQRWSKACSDHPLHQHVRQGVLQARKRVASMRVQARQGSQPGWRMHARTDASSKTVWNTGVCTHAHTAALGV
jgi:hypothetical protein